MSSKAEYERIFNELFGVSVRWSRLSKEELAQLAVVFTNPEILLEKLGYTEKLRNEAVRQKLINTAQEFIQSYDGPLINALRNVIYLRDKKGGDKNERQTGRTVRH